MMFIEHGEDIRSEDVPQSLNQAMGQFVDANLKSGVLIDTAGLMPTRDGTRIHLRGGKLRTVDGPFTESKEVVGGYAICECRDKRHALEIATQFMDLHRIHWPEFEGTCEVRPLEVFD